MKKKGFTLIELLAVIIILAIIALIAVPVVLNVVDSAKKSSFESSAYGIVDAIKLKSMENRLKGTSLVDDYTFPSDKLEVQGSQPTGGTALIDENGRIQIAIYNEKWCATKSYTDNVITVKEYIEGECIVSSPTQLSTPTISIEGSMLSIVSEDENVQSFDIYVDGVKKGNVAVTTEKAVKNIWVFNDNPNSVEQNFSVDCTFTSNGTSYYGLNIITNQAISYATSSGIGARSFIVYSWIESDENYLIWADEAYKTIDFGATPQVVSQVFYGWLINNATPQEVYFNPTKFDLSTFNLDSGTHSITVKAIGDNYVDSDESESVNYEI